MAAPRPRGVSLSDAHSNAMVAGNILGAYFGPDGLPPHWRQGLRSGDWLSGKVNQACALLGLFGPLAEGDTDASDAPICPAQDARCVLSRIADGATDLRPDLAFDTPRFVETSLSRMLYLLHCPLSLVTDPERQPHDACPNSQGDQVARQFFSPSTAPRKTGMVNTRRSVGGKKVRLSTFVLELGLTLTLYAAQGRDDCRVNFCPQLSSSYAGSVEQGGQARGERLQRSRAYPVCRPGAIPFPLYLGHEFMKFTGRHEEPAASIGRPPVDRGRKESGTLRPLLCRQIS